MSKDHGGFEVLDIQAINQSLLVKWLWNLENSEGMWQTLLSMKYLRNKTLSSLTKGSGVVHISVED